MRGVELTELTAFKEVGEQLSFAKAAATLSVSRPALSRTIGALEDRLGVRLLNRTTRNVALTDSGKRLLQELAPVLASLDTLLEDINRFGTEPRGLIRLSMAPSARTMLEPLLAVFLAEFPEITLEISLNAVPVNIIEEGFDAGIRLGETIERDMIALRLTENLQPALVAAPEYLKSHPAPLTPRDLHKHNCLRYRLSDGSYHPWIFEQGGDRPFEVKIEGSLVVNDDHMLVRAVLDGIGIGHLPEKYVEPLVRAGKVVKLLEGWVPASSGYYLYYPSRAHLPVAMREFIKFIRTHLKRNPERLAPFSFP